jgi:hypothetical protein
LRVKFKPKVSEVPKPPKWEHKLEEFKTQQEDWYE